MGGWWFTWGEATSSVYFFFLPRVRLFVPLVLSFPFFFIPRVSVSVCLRVSLCKTLDIPDLIPYFFSLCMPSFRLFILFFLFLFCALGLGI